MLAELIADPTFWVGVALAIFAALIVYLKVPGVIAKQLDGRADAIRAELDQARQLRLEAERVLKEYDAKRVAAEAEAQAIVEAAKLEAVRVAHEAELQLAATIERRTKAAEQKIAQAEMAATAEVRMAAARAATAAAELVLKEQMTEAKGDALIEQAVRELRAKLH